MDHRPSTMSRNGKSRLQLNSASNRSSLRLPTWEEESQVAMSFAQLSPGSVDKFLASIGYLFGFRVDYHTGPRKSLFQAASMKAGQRGYFQDLNEVETELSHTHSERETNYLHKGWLGSALSPISPWTQLRIDSNNQHNRAEAFTTKRIIAPRLHVEILQEDLVPAPGLEAAVKEALELSSQPERIQAIYQIFERWGDMIPLIFDVGISVTVTDRKSNYEANPINLSSHELWRLIEHSTARVSTQGVNLGALQNGLGAWMYECDVLVCQWSQVRVVKAIPVTAILDKELQLRLLEAHNLLISFDPLVLKGEPHSGFTRDDAPLAAKLIKSVTVWGSDQITSLHVTYRDGTVSAQQRSDKGSGNTFSLNDGEYICLVVVWRDSKGVCAIQFFTTYGLVSDCYGGGGGIPTIMGNNGGYLAALMDVMDRDTVYELQALWRHDVNCFKPSDTWKFSQYYGSGGGSRFDDLALINHSTSTYITSVKVRGGSYRTIDGIQLTYSHREGSTRVTLEGSYHGGSGAKEDTLVLTAKEYIVAVKGKVDDYIVQLGFVTNLGRTCTVSGHGDGQEFASEAPLGVDGKPMRLHSIFGRCESRLHGVLFVWATV